jgi:hypothetical protein
MNIRELSREAGTFVDPNEENLNPNAFFDFLEGGMDARPGEGL